MIDSNDGISPEPDAPPHMSDHEKRNIVEHFIEEGPDLTIAEVEEALGQALQEISPSEDRDDLIRAMNGILGSEVQ